MGPDLWAGDPNDEGGLRRKLRSLVEDHEAFLLDEQLRTEVVGVDPLPRGPWDARTDVIVLQLGSAAAHDTTGDRTRIGSPDESDGDSDDEVVGRDLWAGSARACPPPPPPPTSSFAQLLGGHYMAPAAAPSTSSAGAADGEALFRVVVTLSAMTAEMQSLAKDAHEYFLPPLCLLGDRNSDAGGPEVGEGENIILAGGAKPDAGGSASAIPTDEAMAGVAQLMQRHMQELWAWQQRGSRVAVYALRQLAALYSAEHGDHKRSAFHALTEVRFPVVWQALADLLGAMTTIEEVLQQNTSFKQGYVRLRRVLAHLLRTAHAAAAAVNAGEGEVGSSDSLDDDNGLVDGAAASAALPASLTEDRVRALQEVVARVGDDLLRQGRALRLIARDTAAGSAAGPPYTGSPTVSPPEPVPLSSLFRRELVEVMGFMLQSVENALGTEREGAQLERVVGLASLYQVSLALLEEGDGPSVTGPSHDVGRRLFALSTRLPLVPLHGNYALPLCEWMARRMPQHAHLFLLGRPIPAPRATPRAADADTLRALVTAAASQAHTTSVARRLREHMGRLPVTLDRTTTLVSAWLAEMAALPLPGVSAPPVSADVSVGHEGGHSTAARPPRFTETVVLLLQRGLLLAQGLRHTIVMTLTLLRATGTPVSSHTVDAIRHAVEMLMMVREAFHAKSGVLAATFASLTRSIAYVIAKHLHATRAAAGNDPSSPSLSPSSPPSTEELRHRSQRRARDQALMLLQGPLTPDSLLLLSLLLDVLANRRRLPTVTSVRNGAGDEAGAGDPSTTGATPMSDHSRAAILMAFAQLTRVMEYQTTLRGATTCAMLYWQRDALYPRFFRSFYERPSHASRLPYVAAALGDCVPEVLMAGKHVSDPQAALLAPYRRLVMRCLRAELLRPLCTAIEDDLRLCTHGAVLGQPFRTLVAPSATSARPGTVAAVRDLGRLTRLPPVKLLGDWLDLAARVEDHLEAQFYNLNALMPNDWKTYEEMRNLALVRYGLTVTVSEGSLPGGIVDQGLDVLVVTEDIQLFIAHYTYSLNEQIFIQRPRSTQAKHLHTLHTRHVANSIRTHGTGIMNSTVSYVYRCLLKKLSTLSRFLADETVKSRLMKDERRIALARGGQQRAGGSTFVYTLSMAELFKEDLRVLGVADDGETFLTKFTRLVSEIGNALGYMRMIRGGGLRAIADAAQFLPRPASHARAAAGGVPAPTLPHLARHLPQESSLLVAVSDGESRESGESGGSTSGGGSSGSGSEGGSEGGSEVLSANGDTAASRILLRRRQRARAAAAVAGAVRNVDQVADSMNGKLSDGSDYLRMLLEAVGKALGLSRASGSREPRDPTLEHLRLFYLIVPPMCVGFVSDMIREKERLMKRSTDALFTDDGFGLGCVFLLSLFGVLDAFHALHFFDGAREEYVGKLRAVHEAMMAAPDAAPATVGAATTSQSVRARYADRDAEEASNLHLAAAMLDTTLREYTGLEETFVGSSIFFRAEPRLVTGGATANGELEEGRRRRGSGRTSESSQRSSSSLSASDSDASTRSGSYSSYSDSSDDQ